MKTYLVSWEIEVDAESPFEAAQRARDAQTRSDTIAVVFDVFEDGHFKGRVDLLDGSVTQ